MAVEDEKAIAADVPELEQSVKALSTKESPDDQTDKKTNGREVLAESVKDPNRIELQEEAPKKKKKKRKAKKNNNKPSGFEEFFVETPLTPEQFRETSVIYGPQKTINERIETCIQRYRAKRKWDVIRMQAFNAFLLLGGVRTGQKQFTGGLEIEEAGEDGEDADAENIAAQRATDFVRNLKLSNRNRDDWTGDPNVLEDDEETWVDFEYITKAFISHSIPKTIVAYNTDVIVTCIKTIRNFLNYIIFHNVVPEYSKNVHAALKICDKGESEWLMAYGLLSRLPGRFNMACSAVFGGYYQGLYESDVENTWEGKVDSPPVGMPIAEARVVYNVAAATFLGRNEKIEDIHLVSRCSIAFEILERDIPASGGKHLLGSMKCKLWAPEGERKPKVDIDEFTLWAEKEVLQYALVGMKLEATVYTLSNGVRYFDTTLDVYLSFYTYHEPPVDTKEEGETKDDDE